MAEYIELEALKQKIVDEQTGNRMDNHPAAYKVGYHNGLTMAIAMAINAPAADVAPVVHGRWDRTNRLGEFDRYNAHCTNCGYEIGASGWSCEWKLPYCPSCGARMDGE